MKIKTSRKLYSGLVLCGIVSLAGCGGGGGDSNTTTSTTSNTPDPAVSLTAEIAPGTLQAASAALIGGNLDTVPDDFLVAVEGSGSSATVTYTPPVKLLQPYLDTWRERRMTSSPDLLVAAEPVPTDCDYGYGTMTVVDNGTSGSVTYSSCRFYDGRLSLAQRDDLGIADL